MTDFLWFLLLIAIIFLPWDRIWDRLLGKGDEESEMDACAECDTDELLRMKLECLRLANIEGQTTAQIIERAQAFWDFISKDDDEDNE
jgi:hypothetical protein